MAQVDKGNSINRNFKMIGDSGATHHMVNDLSILHQAETPLNEKFIQCANNKDDAKIKIEKIGKIIVKNGLLKELVLNKVLYSKYIGENLLAFPKAADAGYDILLAATKAILLSRN